MNEVKENRKLSKFNKWFYIGLGITFAAQAVVSVVIFLYEFYAGYGGDGIITPLEKPEMLANIFMIPSVLTILLYLLMFVSKEGAFDAISYGAKLVFYSVFAKNMRQTKLPATYGEYRLMKQQKERNSSIFLLFAAIPFFIVGIVFVILAGVNYQF